MSPLRRFSMARAALLLAVLLALPTGAHAQFREEPVRVAVGADTPAALDTAVLRDDHIPDPVTRLRFVILNLIQDLPKSRTRQSKWTY